VIAGDSGSVRVRVRVRAHTLMPLYWQTIADTQMTLKRYFQLDFPTVEVKPLLVSKARARVCVCVCVCLCLCLCVHLYLRMCSSLCSCSSSVCLGLQSLPSITASHLTLARSTPSFSLASF
jgi:hypothetical protein